MNPAWECGLINLINSYLAFFFFSFSYDNVIATFRCSRQTLAYSNQSRFPLDFLYTFTEIVPSVLNSK